MDSKENVVKNLAGLVRLNASEKRLLMAVAEGNANATATALVESGHLPASTVWHNLRKLGRKGLIEFGKGKPILLTELGGIVCSFFPKRLVQENLVLR